MNLSSLLRGSNDAGSDALSRHRFLPTRAGLIELVVLFGALVLIDRMIMQPGEFAKLQPHPYWLPVILLSLQYGTADGVLAAAVAILVNLVMGWSTQGIAEDYYYYIVRVWAVPICWIITAIIIGEVRARQRSQITELGSALASSRQQAADITDHCYKLEDKIQRLEREFATAEAFSLDSLTAALTDLHQASAQDWPDALARVHRGVLGAGTLSLYVRGDRGFERVCKVSAPPETARSEPAVLDDAATRAALSRLLQAATAGRSLNAIEAEDAPYLDGLASMALPVTISGDATRREPATTAAIIVDGIPPERLSLDTQGRLELLCREIASALPPRTLGDLMARADAAARIELPGEAVELAEPALGEATGRRLGIFPRFGRA